MKKMIFSAAAFALVAVSGMALAPTTASAIPAFARQTGAACLSCHFQAFPAINAFGRAFKMGSFTDVGDEALVEDDNLSLPAVLNASVVIRGDMTNTNPAGAGASTTVYNVPSETPILIGGRIGTNSGAFIEFANGGTDTGPGTNPGAVTVGNWQFLNSFDVGGFKVGLSAHNSGFAASGIMEVSNVFGQHGGKLGGKSLSAMQNLGFRQGILGVGTWIGNDLGIVQFSLVAPGAAQGTNVGGKFGKLVRVIATLDVAGWDTLIGFTNISGSAGKTVATGGPGEQPMNMQAIDVQFQGDVGDMSVGVYGDWMQANGRTAADGSGNGNIFGVTNGASNTTNIAGTDSNGFSIRVEAKPLDRILFGVGYGYEKQTTALTSLTVKQFQVAGTYEVYQNFDLNLIYNSKKDEVTNGAGIGATGTTTLEFEALL